MTAGIGKADALITCHRCGTLAVLRYSSRAARFIVVQRITVASAPAATGRPQGPPVQATAAQPDDPTTLVGSIAVSDPRGRAIALAATRHRVSVFFAAAYATPSDPQAFEEAMKVRLAGCAMHVHALLHAYSLSSLCLQDLPKSFR